MQIVLTKTDVDALAKRIVEYLWEEIPTGAIPEKPKTVEEVVAEPVKELTAKKEASEPVKEEAAKPQITTAELRKAVMEFTRNNQDNLTKTKEILSGMGIEQLSQLEGDLINQFVEKFVAIGGKI
nr:MAG TPA: hypothetical protein [Caudoviricetes sp.]